MRQALRELATRVLATRLGSRLGRASGLNRRHTLFRGPFPDWSHASEASSGYSDPTILDQAARAARSTFEGKAGYDQDGVTFEEIEYSWPLAAAVMTVAAHAAARRGPLLVVDIGGALGSVYRQLTPLLDSASIAVDWRIVDLPAVVECGRRAFQSTSMTFHESIAEAVDGSVPDLALFSGSLQYFEDPYEALQSACESRPTYVVFDRTPMSPTARDRIFVQDVAHSITPVSYPLHLLDQTRVDAQLQDDWELVARWESRHQPITPNATWQGALWQRRSESGDR